MRLSSSGSGVQPPCLSCYFAQTAVRSSKGGFPLSVDRAASKACCISTATCLCFAEHPLFDSTSQGRRSKRSSYFSSCFSTHFAQRESRRPRGAGAGGTAHRVSSRDANPQHHQLHRTGFFRYVKGAGKSGMKISGKAYGPNGNRSRRERPGSARGPLCHGYQNWLYLM